MVDKAVSHRTRVWLSIVLVAASVVGIVVISITVLRSATDKQDAARLVFASILPLLGSWVGTILAFYFSRENLEAATDSAERLTQMTYEERLRAVPAADKMIPLGAMEVRRIEEGGENTILLSSLTDSDRTRHPILTVDNRPKYLVHRSLVDRFLAKKSREAASTAESLERLTLADLLADAEMRKTAVFATVGPTATLAEAKSRMEALPRCQDVLITEDGTAESAVRGWLTNIDIGRAAQAVGTTAR